MRPRIILMYISEVSGHHSATLAIEKALKKLAPQAQILNINAFNYTNPISEKVINRLYIEVIKRTPRIWDYLYDNPDVVKKIAKIKEVVHRFNSPKFKELFDEFKPDAVLCTQAFPCGMVADYKKTYASDIPLIAVLTDYIPHAYWIYDKVDYYITPSEDVSKRLQERGVLPGKIRALGIPFDLKFNEPQDRGSLVSKFKLNLVSKNILIMGGGQGFGPIKTIIKSLERVKADIQEIVVTGTNKKLFNSLRRRIKKYKKRILLLGYINNINEMMELADIIITKPGGVTTAEVLSRSLPMIIVKPIPGQEANNAKYLTEKGAAIQTDKPKEINFIIEELLGNADRINHMRVCSQRIGKPKASLDIANLLLNICAQRDV